MTLIRPPEGLAEKMNICFGKLEVSVIIAPMDAIDIGNSRTPAGAVGRARPRVDGGFGGSFCPPGETRRRPLPEKPAITH